MILVTGGTGLVGSHLIFDLVNSGKKVRGLKRSTSKLTNVENIFSLYSDGENRFNEIEWVNGDVLDIFSLEDAMKGVEYIYHCAAIVSFSPQHKTTMMNINIEGTANVINTALELGIKKICHVSSIAALGREDSGDVISEKTLWKTSRKNSMYAISKYGAEREVWRGTIEGLNAVVVNPSVILGCGDWSTGSLKIIKLVWKGLKFYTNGSNGFVDVKDVTRSMIGLMDSNINNERFIISSGNLSYKDIFTKMAKYLNKKPPYIFVNSFFSNIGWRVVKILCILTNRTPTVTMETARTANQKYRYSNEKIKKALNFEFTPIDKTIQDTCHSFLKDIKH